MSTSQKLAIHVVWLKRDLRIKDHRPLSEASKSGQVVVLYVFEPSLWATPEMDRSHFDFICESLVELEATLGKIGGRLAIRVGEIPKVFEDIEQDYAIAGLYSHEETGNGLTFDRDKRVISWARERNIPWREFPQTGVIRRLKSRNGWAELWHKRMSERQAETPFRISVPFEFDWGALPSAESLGLPNSTKSDVQQGGEACAYETLQEFLNVRGVNYRKGMSSPVTAHHDCSRLSPYLAWGCISMKTVYQTLGQRRMELQQMPSQVRDSRWLASLNSFQARLAWHCHFMQKLEDEPSIEFQNMNRAYDGLREDEFNAERFEAWQAGRTGYPMIDACMRALHETSWINFRMRAMLVSFASNHLWLHWRPTAVYLAKHFLDFEPGIHFSQFQMQSGTTGINTIRIYSPAKQVIDHDPNGTFIRKYVPELANVPDEYLAEPHRMPASIQSQSGCIVGQDYPAPIVNHKVAYKHAKDRIFAIRHTESAVKEANRVFVKHGSRKKRDPLPKAKTAKQPSHKQLSLFDDLDNE
jgi:deoxyribodipyrimidine photo-lyase